MKKIIINSVLAGILLPTLTACKAEESTGNIMNTELCREKMSVFFENEWRENPLARVTAIEALSSTCSGIFVYEAGLANAYFTAGMNLNARDVATKALKLSDTDYEFFTDLIFKTFINENNFEKAQSTAQHALAEKPDSYIGYLLMSKYQVSINKNHEAIKYANQALEKGAGFEASTMLITALYNLNHFQEAVVSFEHAKNESNNIYSDINAVLAASASYYEIDNKQAALDFLNRHIELVPESSSHPLVIKMYEILAQP